ncbi:hypothetical protein HBI56_121440 [Parastagonospora nodorum]|uniref:Fungal N-terminal domain-containing protein n=1 Tax=Phaeosphaeria nodorum (strain SN15 / ATCC MYA-4574 / FGSC 10173) TaxID=321614 RepID=A0A7U2FG58_PHANO|nr:hypothetical protein HBH56_053300 [Parastagonospora nodorum]QRD02246.1 hypothetical protein JI435_303660 [Parastagonospora nodorum SN15]KAH3935490.1 hypothetical protein HBH54_039100 [Parastagonospora nodorum]KAH3970071.1 hypothetical protein HBH51_119070 [Parastagonospora nodorum]KAH3988712.1 hypothetical protein HBH52_027760 [Parastagonospora nodorum]
MAEIGLIASVVQVAGAGLKLSHTLYQYVDGVATADRRIKDIATEIRLTSFVIEELGNVFKSDETKTLISKGALKTADETMKECSDVFAEIDATLKKSKKNTFGRLMLPFRDTKIELLRSHIDKLKDTLTLLLGVLSVAHHVATKKLDRKAEAEAKAQIQELIELKKKSAKKYEESLKNFSISDGSSQTLLDDADTETVEETVQVKAADEDPSAPLSAMAIASSINPKTLETCVQHVRSLLDSIETLQQALTSAVDGSDHSTHHQSLIDSYFLARGHLDGVIFRGSPQQDLVTDTQPSVESTKKPSLPSGLASAHSSAKIRPEVVIEFGTTKGKVSAGHVSVSTKSHRRRFDDVDARSAPSDTIHTVRTELDAALESHMNSVDDKSNIAPRKASSHGISTDERSGRSGYPEAPSPPQTATSNPQPSSSTPNVNSDPAPGDGPTELRDNSKTESIEALVEHSSADDKTHDGLISGLRTWDGDVRHDRPQYFSSKNPLRLSPQYEDCRGQSLSHLITKDDWPVINTERNTSKPFYRSIVMDLQDQSSGKDTAVKPSETNTPHPAHTRPTLGSHDPQSPVVSDTYHRRKPLSSRRYRPSSAMSISTSNNEPRLRVDGTMPLSLQLSGDMEGRTLQLVPAASGTTDMVIGGNGSRSSGAVYRSERGSATSDDRYVIASQRRREAENVSEKSSRSPRLRSKMMSQRSDPNPYFSPRTTHGPAVVQTARPRRAPSASRPRLQSFAGDPDHFGAPGMPVPSQTSYYPHDYNPQQYQPSYAQGPPPYGRPLSSRTQREYSAPLITQEGQSQYSARYGSAPLPTTRPSPSQTLPLQYGEQDFEESSESEYSENEEDEREVRQRQERAARALMPPPKSRRDTSQRRPTLAHAKTTQVVEHLEANRREKRRQSIIVPDRADPRERHRYRERAPASNADPTRRPSVSRPTPRPLPHRSTQSEYNTRRASIVVNDSRSNQRASSGQDKDRAAEGRYDAARQRVKRANSVKIQQRYMSSLSEDDDDSDKEEDDDESEEEVSQDDAWALIDNQENTNLTNKVNEDAKSRKAELIAEEYINATRGSRDPYADQINKAALKRASRKPSLPSTSSGSKQNVTGLLPDMGSGTYLAKVEDYCSDESEGGHVLKDGFPRRSSPTAQANVSTRRSKDLSVERTSEQHHSNGSSSHQSRTPLSRTASVSSKPRRHAHQRRPTIAREKRDHKELECRDLNCTDCGLNTLPPRPRRPELQQTASTRNVAGYPSDTISQRSDPNPYYSTPSPVYNRQPAPYASQGPAVVQPARTMHVVERAEVLASPEAIRTELQEQLSDTDTTSEEMDPESSWKDEDDKRKLGAMSINSLSMGMLSRQESTSKEKEASARGDSPELPGTPTLVLEDFEPKEYDDGEKKTADMSPKDDEHERDKEGKDLDVLEILAKPTEASSKTQMQSRAGRKATKRKLPYITGSRGAAGVAKECSVDVSGGSEDEMIFSRVSESRRRASALQDVTVDASKGVAWSGSGEDFDEVDELLKEWTTVF